jgi:GDPmannose 4,6-dehydratase
MWLMLQQDSPDDYVIATGQTHTLESFVTAAFAAFDLDWRRHVEQNSELFRPTDLLVSRADPSNAEVKLGWKANFGLSEVIGGMVGEFIDPLD